MGSCPVIKPLETFNVDKFNGTWYVIEIFGRHTKCMTLTFEKKTNTSLTVTQAMEFYMLDKVNIDYAHANTGTLEILDKTNPSKMQIRWPDNIAGSATFNIVDTDHSSYALIVECQKLLFLSRTNAAILSREPFLKLAVKQKLQGQINTMDLDATDFSAMKHENCIRPEDSDVDLGFVRDQVYNAFGFVQDDKINQINDEEEMADYINFGDRPRGR
ncbi:unnamed protein product [Meganyctiphanes norvegica]|uniref:Lipocalin/cytosolic fatty-acid binding domain-containing protein n=1 Tax=Meganyctiphanes norvegica TaxID=48144 RepID=A0AAV2RKA6_MEGNR